MGLARKASVRQDRRVGVGAVDHGGNPTFLSLCPEGAVNDHALRLLNARDHPCKEVVAVFPYGAAYKDMKGRLMTAWITREGMPGGPERVSVWTEPGLPAFADDGDE